MNDIRLYGSHLPILIKAVELTSGPILELGMGVSTWIIDMLCKPDKRKIVSYENDLKWWRENTKYTSDYHDIFYISDWEFADIDKSFWSIVLIDHRPALRRRKDVLRMKDKANFIVLHDTEPEIDRFYRYSGIYHHFKYRYDYTKIKPNTTVLSNFIDISKVI